MNLRLGGSSPGTASPWFPFYYALVVAGGTGALAWMLPSLAGTSWLLAALWFALIFFTDAAPVNLPGGGFITVSSTVDYAGILILGPVPTALAEFAATLVLQLGVQRRPFHKAIFNASAFAGTVLAAGWAFRLLGGVPGAPLAFPHILVPLLGMGLTYYGLNTMIVSFVIALSEGRRVWQVWQVNYIWTIFHMVASLPFGAAIAVAYRSLNVWGVVLFVLPLLLARYSFKLYIETKRDLLDFAGVLAGVIDEFDPYTRKHSQRVSVYSARIAREMGLSEREVERVEYGGLLHDIGKIKMSQRDLILKPGRLTPAERARISLHASLGAEILERVRAFQPLAPLVRYHHERMDGMGYHKLPARELPMGARIVMAADAFDAMTSDRVYRKALTLADSLAELRRCAGTQFDASVVAAIERLVGRGELTTGDEVPAAEPEPLTRPGLVNAGLV